MLALSIDINTCSFEGLVLGFASLNLGFEGTDMVFEFLDLLEVAKGSRSQELAASSEGHNHGVCLGIFSTVWMLVKANSSSS